MREPAADFRLPTGSRIGVRNSSTSQTLFDTARSTRLVIVERSMSIQDTYINIYEPTYRTAPEDHEVFYPSQAKALVSSTARSARITRV